MDVGVGGLVDDGGSDVIVTLPVTTGTGMNETGPVSVICVAWVPSLTISVHNADPFWSPHCTFTDRVMVCSWITAISETCASSSTSVTAERSGT